MTIPISPFVARVAGVLLCALAAGAVPAARDYEFRHDNVLGTSLELCVRAENDEAARLAEARVLGEIDRLAAVFSGYDAASEFRRWQATVGKPTKVSPELFELLGASDRWREQSDGAFDPRVQALTELWSRCARLDRLPTADEQAKAKALMARPAWRLDAAAGTAEHLTACPLSLNSIAKGYIIGRACDVALDRERGVRGVLLNIGGDVRVVGEVARTVGVAPPVGDSETAEPIARVEVARPVGRHERQFPARVPYPRHVVFAHIRPSDGPARRAGGGRDRHRRAGHGRECAGHHAQRAPRRGRPAPGRVHTGRRVPRRHGRRAGPQERRVVPLRATVDCARRPGDAGRPGPGSENRPGRLVGRHV